MLELFGLYLLYVTAFWGQAAGWLPAPFDRWHSLAYRLLGPWWLGHVATALGLREQTLLYQLAEAVIVGVCIPLWILHRQGRTWRDAAIGLPRPASMGPIIAGIACSLPLGFYLSRTVPDPWGSPLHEALASLLVIPEHLLIFGVLGALLLPRASSSGRFEGHGTPAFTTFGIAAMAAMAATFGLVHVGQVHPAVLISSFPLGALYAYVTVRTRSIWPAIGAHWIMNIIPFAWDTLRA